MATFEERETSKASTETTTFADALMIGIAVVASLFSYALVAKGFVDLSTLG